MIQSHLWISCGLSSKYRNYLRTTLSFRLCLWDLLVIIFLNKDTQNLNPMLCFNKFICFSLLGRRIICKKNSLIQESSNNKMEILTDARHGWRKNAQQTDVVCLGNKNKKSSRIWCGDISWWCLYPASWVIRHKEDIWEAQPAMGCSQHTCSWQQCLHLKIVREQRPTNINLLDNWHALKQLEKSLKAIADGIKKKLGITWHGELMDKPHPIRTHTYYAFKNVKEISLH